MLYCTNRWLTLCPYFSLFLKSEYSVETRREMAPPKYSKAHLPTHKKRKGVGEENRTEAEKPAVFCCVPTGQPRNNFPVWQSCAAPLTIAFDKNQNVTYVKMFNLIFNCYESCFCWIRKFFLDPQLFIPYYSKIKEQINNKTFFLCINRIELFVWLFP